MRILLVVLLVLIVAGLPGMPYWGPNHTYGYYPSGGIGVLFVILLVLLLVGYL